MGLCLIGVPISVAIGPGAMLAVVFSAGMSSLLVPTAVLSSMDYFVLTAVPLFMLTGTVNQHGRLSDLLFGFADSRVGWMPPASSRT